MECDGEERHISECRFGDHEAHADRHLCSGTEKAGVICRKTSRACEEFQYHCADGECIHVNNLCDGLHNCRDGSDEDASACSAPLQIRLADGEDPRSGRVEVRHKGVWGTVCDDHFGREEARVVCRMLGYGSATSVARVYNGTTDYRGSGPVWIRFTAGDRCSGSEDSLEDCVSSDLWQHDHYCSHAEDVAVTCALGYDDEEDESESSSVNQTLWRVNKYRIMFFLQLWICT